MRAVPVVWRTLLLACACLLVGCSEASRTPPADAPGSAPTPGADGRLFTMLSPAVTGVHFANRLHDTRDLNVFAYRNYYNGGGVALGDLTGDSLPELVLTSNHDGPKLYLNEGHFRFRDVTGAAGLESAEGSWTTGVTLADVNGDGRLDVYICKAGPGEPSTRANELWINQGPDADGVPRFVEKAKEYGVADEGWSTQAAFLDYDHDGDLDLFVINNSPRNVGSFGPQNVRNVADRFGGAKLYRNDRGHFTDVTSRAGIFSPENGFGLGLAVADVNRDGWPDVYVSNDFAERDFLYVNNRDGTFREVLDRAMPVVSYYSMGLDVADVNNDGWPDVYTTDMLPEDEARLKTLSQYDAWDVYRAKVVNGYHHQLMRNMLQLNNASLRSGQAGDVPTFSDVGQLAGVARTDWSWSALIADLDLDGYKDIYVTNGLAKDVTSQDYIAYLGSQQTMRQVTSGGRVDYAQLVGAMTSTPIPNYAFHNNGDLTFTNESAAWGLAMPSFSNGAAYGDLDGDGALDLVVNNVNAEAFVYRNNARALLPKHHYLQVRLEGEGQNRFALGARVTLWTAGTQRMQELDPTRGFQSSVDYVLTFGLGLREDVDSLVVDWPDGRRTVETKVAANRRVTVKQAGAQAAPAAVPNGTPPLLTDVSDPATLDFTHRENDFVDFERERLIPKMLSTEGPALAVGDVNRDGLDDVYIGGAKEQAGALLVQQKDGRFVKADTALFAADAISEDVGAVFFDANGDGAPDLYVVSGGNEYSEGAPALQDRLYLNDGSGHFRKATNAIPEETVSGSRAVAADYDGDGRTDLFVGGRVVPWQYGVAPRSTLLRNDGRGHFTDVTEKLAPELAHVGMVTDALWQDVDGDGRLDLVVVGEWMPITVFHNAGGGRLVKQAVKGLEQSDGWWNRIVAGDFDGDGRVDFVVANLGLNSRLHASAREPATMYVKDFGHDGYSEPIVACYNHGVSYPVALRDELLGTLPYLRTRYATYASYAKQSLADVFSPAELADAVVDRAYTFATSLVHNDGDGSFSLVALPTAAQLAPVYGIVARDVDGDGKTDLLLAGNFDGFPPGYGRMAASYGLLLKGNGAGGFRPLAPRESGFFVPGQSRDIARVRTKDGALYVVARNNDRPLLFRAPAPPK